MAHIKLSLPVLEGFGPGKLFIVADQTTDYGQEAAKQLGGQYLGSDLVAAEAACVDGRGDTILIGPGVYTLTTKLTCTKDDVTFIAAKYNPTAPTVKITSSLADTVEVEADNVTFKGIEFEAGDNACANLINVADTVAVNGLTIEGCVFDPNGKATVLAIAAIDATYAMTGARIVNNTFLKGFDTTIISIGVLGMANSVIEGNFFQVLAAKTGIALADTSAFATGYGARIRRNEFLGGDATGDEVGIAIAGTENTTGAVMITENIFGYSAAAAVTADKITGSIVLNYTATDQSSGGALVDPST